MKVLKIFLMYIVSDLYVSVLRRGIASPDRPTEYLTERTFSKADKEWLAIVFQNKTLNQGEGLGTGERGQKLERRPLFIIYSCTV